MKILANREGLLAAFGMVASACPSRSPKPILQNVKLTVTDDGATLSATDLEVGITCRVFGVKTDNPGSVILPTQRVQQILRTCRDEELAIETEGDTLHIRGLHSTFEMPTDDPDLFPDVPDFAASAYHVVTSGDFKQAIRRTMFATDVESTRYALGGVLFEFADDTLSLVGTDGRRLARQITAVETEGEPAVTGKPVVPVKALKLIDRNLDSDDPPVHIAFVSGTSVMVRTERSVIYSRLVEGRFPNYADVFPKEAPTRIVMSVEALLLAVEQASIVTSEESRGVDFDFTTGILRLSSQAADVGKSKVESMLDFDGASVGVTFDVRYLAECLKTLELNQTITIELIDHKNACVFRTDDSLAYVVMPLTKER